MRIKQKLYFAIALASVTLFASNANSRWYSTEEMCQRSKTYCTPLKAYIKLDLNPAMFGVVKEVFFKFNSRDPATTMRVYVTRADERNRHQCFKEVIIPTGSLRENVSSRSSKSIAAC